MKKYILILLGSLIAISQYGCVSGQTVQGPTMSTLEGERNPSSEKKMGMFDYVPNTHGDGDEDEERDDDKRSALESVSPTVSRTKAPMRSLGVMCDGYPSLQDIKLPEGFCAGRMLSDSKLMKKPRMIAQYGNHYFVIDMVNWGTNSSKLFRLEKQGNSWNEVEILSAADLKNSKVLTAQGDEVKNPESLFNLASALMRGPNSPRELSGRIFVGSATQIWSFDPTKALKGNKRELIASIRVHLSGFKIHSVGNERRHLHPLKHFVFDPRGNLVVNLGSITDNCQGHEEPPTNAGAKSACELFERDAGKNVALASIAVFRYEGGLKFSPTADATQALGLRNSIALAVHPKTNFIFQGENARDNIHKAKGSVYKNAEEPKDELNIIDFSKSQDQLHFGWPFCFSNNLDSPEFKGRCDSKRYRSPAALLPAHSAPLGMIFYSRSGTSGANTPALARAFPEWYEGKLFIALHGPAPNGNRIAVADVTEDEVKEVWEFLGDWGPKKTRPAGRPFGLLQDADGSLLIVDDVTRSIVRVTYSPGSSSGNEIPKYVIDPSGKTLEPSPDEKEKMKAMKAALEAKIKANASKLASDPKDSSAKSRHSLAVMQSKVIDAHCLDCHNPMTGQKPDFVPFADVWNAKLLLGLDPTKKGQMVPARGAKKYVELGKALNESIFYHYIDIHRMPPGGIPDDADGAKKAEALRLIADWIQMGAPILE